MDRIGDHLDESIQERDMSNLSCGFFLDHVGEVSLTLNPDGLSWKFIDSLCNVSFSREWKRKWLSNLGKCSSNLFTSQSENKERAGQASEAMASMTNRELNSYDGAIAIDGDGFFNEILNGILLSRHKAPYPPTPPDDDDNIETENDILPRDSTVTAVEPAISNEDESPLLKRSSLDDPRTINLSQDSEMSFPNEQQQHKDQSLHPV